MQTYMMMVASPLKSVLKPLCQNLPDAFLCDDRPAPDKQELAHDVQYICICRVSHAMQCVRKVMNVCVTDVSLIIVFYSLFFKMRNCIVFSTIIYQLLKVLKCSKFIEHFFRLLLVLTKVNLLHIVASQAKSSYYFQLRQSRLQFCQ